MMSIIDFTEINHFIIEAADGAISMEDIESVNSNLKSLGMDSLTQMQLMVLLEEKYQFEVDFEEAIALGVLDSHESLIAFIKQASVNNRS